MGYILLFLAVGLNYNKLGSGTCLNSAGQHPPWEQGTSANNHPDTCFEDCKKRASIINRICTGFDIRPKCAYYYDEEITTTQFGGSIEGCYKVRTEGKFFNEFIRLVQ